MEKPISRPCLLLVFAAAMWVVLALHLRFDVLTAAPVVIAGRKAASSSSVTDDGSRGGGGGGGDRCRGRYVYMHDLPPRFNDGILRDCDTAPDRWPHMCDEVSNAGLGLPLAGDGGGALTGENGWYATQQFALDAIFHARMRQYECLTNDSAAAAAVFVPFYAGYEFAMHTWGYGVAKRDAASLDLLRWLVRRPEWRRAGGRDHFLVAGRTAWDFRRDTDPEATWGTRLLFFPAGANMTVLTVETASYGEANDVAVPYPTYFHPRTDADVLNWQRRIRQSNRVWFMSFIGAPRPDDRMSIRSQIIDQCRASPSCGHLGCATGSMQCHSPAGIMELFQSSTFCIQPAGDSMTRRSTFDGMVAGCIPVFFKPRSAYLQYLWHLPRDHASYSVLIPGDGVRSGNVSIEAELRKIPPATVEKMREEVIKLVPRIVYADPRYKLETLKDAFDVTVDGVLERVAKIRGTGD